MLCCAVLVWGVWITRIHTKLSHITSIYNLNVSLQGGRRQRWENFPKLIGKLAWHIKPHLRDPAAGNWKEDKDQHLEVGLPRETGALWHVCTHTHTEERAQHMCVQVSARRQEKLGCGLLGSARGQDNSS